MRLTMPKVKVTQVIDGNTFIVNNTQTVHLPALYIPSPNATEAGIYRQAAKKFLEDTILNRNIAIYQVRDQERGQFNALGHIEGYAVREDGLFIQEEMIAQGMAFAYPSQTHFETADKLYKAEENARANRLGLWSDDQWAIKTDQQAKLMKEDKFAIVEGVIKQVASRNNVIYLNFERDWRKDFTISIDSQKRRDFSKYGYNLMQMNGQAVRVRGWMRDYNGPMIEIFHPSQLELLEKITVQPDETVEKNTDNDNQSDEDRIQPLSPMFDNPTLQSSTQ